MLIDRLPTLLIIANLVLTVIMVYSHIKLIKCVLDLLAAIAKVEHMEDEDE